MGASGLGSRAIIGSFYEMLDAVDGADWIGQTSMKFDSDQASEDYKWLGMAPAMREWIGGRQAKGFRESGITIANKKFEATMEVQVDEIRRDKTGQVMLRVGEMVDRTTEHWAKLLSTLILGGKTAYCYDSQYFFDDDHSEGDSGTQKNLLASGDYATLNISSATAPTVAEFEAALMDMITHMLSIKDDQGEPMNANARAFLLMVPLTFLGAAIGAVYNEVIGSSNDNRIKKLTDRGFTIEVVANPRITWTSEFVLFRTDARTAPFIRQEEEAVKISAIAEGSEEEFKNDRHLYGVKAIRNVGYGYWQQALHATFV